MEASAAVAGVQPGRRGPDVNGLSDEFYWNKWYQWIELKEYIIINTQ